MAKANGRQAGAGGWPRHHPCLPGTVLAVAAALCGFAPGGGPSAVKAGAAVKLEGHTEPLACVAFSPDGKYALTGGGTFGPAAGPKGKGCELRLWDLATGKEVRQFTGHTQRVEAAAFSADGKYALSGSFDKALKLWDVATGKEVKAFTGHRGPVYAVAFSPGGRYLLSGGSDRSARLWDVRTGAELRTFTGHKEAVGCVTFSPDGRRVLTGGWDGTVRLWDLVSGTPLRVLEGHADMVRAVAFSPDGKYALSGGGGKFVGNKYQPGSDHGLRLWDLTSGALAAHFPLPGHIVRRLTFTPDGRRALSCGEDAALHVWDLSEKKHLAEFGKGMYLGWSVGLGRAADGRALMGCVNGKVVAVWRADPEAGAVTAAKPAEDPALAREVFDGHKGGVVEALTLTPDGRLAISGGGDAKSGDYTALAWDPESFAERRRLIGHTDLVRAVACSPKGRFAATAGNDETIRVWDLKGGVQFTTLQLQGAQKLGQVTALAFTPDERYLISAGGGPLVRWDLKTGAPLQLSAPAGFCTSAAVSPKGGLLLVGASDGSVRLFNLRTRQVVRRLRGHTNKVGALGFSADGKRAFTVSGWKLVGNRFERDQDDSIRVWDVATGKPRQHIKGKDGPFNGGALSPDGRLVATAGADGVVRLWDLDAGREVQALRGHTNGVAAVAFFPDGRRLLSAGQDGTVRLWRLPEGTPAP